MTTATSGAGIVDTYAGLVDSIKADSESEGEHVLDVAVGAVLNAGVGWLLEHVSFLREPLDALLGNPDEINANVVDQVELDELTFVRTLCRWRGATFELLGRTRDTADLHLVDEDYLVARDLGLTEVDYRVWRQTVPAAELTDVRTESVPVPLEGQFQ